jgi:hypothetical protein
MPQCKTKPALLCLLFVLAATPAPDNSPLNVQIKLTSDVVMLGQPVWVDVTITNRSNQALIVDIGSECFGAKQLEIEVPDAIAGNGEHTQCGNVIPGGSCEDGGVFKLDPAQVFAKRYVLTGDFRIVHPGIYKVILEKILRYTTIQPEWRNEVPGEIEARLGETARVVAMLRVLPANPDKVLSIEQSMAREAATWETPPPLPASANIDVIRAAAELQREVEWARITRNESIASGLEQYPVAGMEPTFRDWLYQQGLLEGAALSALHQVNTIKARKVLADYVKLSPSNRTAQSERMTALSDLGDMGDSSYLPLMEESIHDSYKDASRTAVFGVGKLGGANGLALLNYLARNSEAAFDRVDAIQSMGYSASLKAVPLLIKLMDLPNTYQPGISSYALSMLTHYNPPGNLRSVPDVKKAWQTWWARNRHTARAYGEYECATPAPSK